MKFRRKVQMKSSIGKHILQSTICMIYFDWISIKKSVFPFNFSSLYENFRYYYYQYSIWTENTSKKKVYRRQCSIRCFMCFFLHKHYYAATCNLKYKKKMWKCWPFYWMLRSAMFREIHTKQSLHFKSLLQANKLLRSKSFKYNTFSNE